MKRLSMVRWAGALTVASAMLASGCQHSKNRLGDRGERGLGRGRSMPTASMPAHPSPYAVTAPPAVATMPAAGPSLHPSAVMLPPVTPQAAPEAPKEMARTEPTPPAAPPVTLPSSATTHSVETAKGNPEKDTTSVEQASSKLEAARVVSKWTSTSPKLEAAPRRSFVDITAHACFGHAEDYGWLSGQLQHLKTKDCWRLRYASVDEDDAHGGSVTLVDKNGLLAGCKDGQYVRITGQLLSAADRSIAPDYQLDSLQAVEMK